MFTRTAAAGCGFHNAVVSAFRACEEIAVVQAFRPSVSGGPEGPHHIRSDFFTGSSGGPSAGPAKAWLKPDTTYYGNVKTAVTL